MDLMMRRRALMGMLGEKGDPFNGHEYVDLGLPSGTLWATKNVGAELPENDGLYFAWGEAVGYADGSNHNFGGDDYKWGKFDNNAPPDYGFTKYNHTDGLVYLEPEDDAVSINMGGKWRLPNHTHFQELKENTTFEKVVNYNGHGRAVAVLTSNINGNKLVIPLSGNWTSYIVNQNEFGFYKCNGDFSGTKYDYIHQARITSDGSSFVTVNKRWNGAPVRGIISKYNKL